MTWKMDFNVSRCRIKHFSRKRLVSEATYYLMALPCNPQDLHSPAIHTLIWESTPRLTCAWKYILYPYSRKSQLNLRSLPPKGLLPLPSDNQRQAVLVPSPPSVECASAGWDPYTQQYINQLEMVQRPSARFVMKINTPVRQACPV